VRDRRRVGGQEALHDGVKVPRQHPLVFQVTVGRRQGGGCWEWIVGITLYLNYMYFSPYRAVNTISRL
jgi:hypothetical protein